MNYYTGNVISNNVKVLMCLTDESCDGHSASGALCVNNTGKGVSVQKVLKQSLYYFCVVHRGPTATSTTGFQFVSFKTKR